MRGGRPAKLHRFLLFAGIERLSAIYAGVRFLPWTTLLFSAALWGAVNVDRTINLTNWLDGQGWIFNPLAWPFLFTLGVFGAVILRANGGGLPRRRSLVIACWAYLIGSCVIAAPWTVWGLAGWHPFAFEPAPSLSWLARYGRHSLEVFSLGSLLALVFRLLFETFGPSPSSRSWSMWWALARW